MKYHMRHYFKPISYANKKLQNLSEAVGSSFVKECLRVLRIPHVWVVDHQTSKRSIDRWIDGFCQKPGSDVASYSQICAIAVRGTDVGLYGSSTIFIIQSDNAEVISALLRFHKLKAFL
jgi:hypothetical protein